MILVDTDVMIDIFREYSPAIVWLHSLGNQEINLPGFVAMELIQGCRNKVELEKIERELAHYAAIPGLRTVQPYEKGSFSS